MVWEHLRPKDAKGTPDNINWKTATVVGTKLYVFGSSAGITNVGGEETSLLYSLDLEFRSWESGWSYIELESGAAHGSITAKVDNKIWILSDPYSIVHCLDLGMTALSVIKSNLLTPPNLNH